MRHQEAQKVHCWGSAQMSSRGLDDAVIPQHSPWPGTWTVSTRMTESGCGKRGLAQGEDMRITTYSADVATNCHRNGKWRAHQSNVGQNARRPARGLYLLRLSNLLQPDQTGLSNRPWYSLNTHYRRSSHSPVQTRTRSSRESLDKPPERFRIQEYWVSFEAPQTFWPGPSSVQSAECKTNSISPFSPSLLLFNVTIDFPPFS